MGTALKGPSPAAGPGARPSCPSPRDLCQAGGADRRLSDPTFQIRCFPSIAWNLRIFAGICAHFIHLPVFPDPSACPTVFSSARKHGRALESPRFWKEIRIDFCRCWMESQPSGAGTRGVSAPLVHSCRVNLGRGGGGAFYITAGGKSDLPLPAWAWSALAFSAGVPVP